MKIQLMKPAMGNYQLEASDASASQLLAFDEVVKAVSYDLGADGWVEKLTTLDSVSTWDMRVQPFLAMCIAHQTASKFGFPAQLARIGE